MFTFQLVEKKVINFRSKNLDESQIGYIQRKPFLGTAESQAHTKGEHWNEEEGSKAWWYALAQLGRHWNNATSAKWLENSHCVNPPIFLLIILAPFPYTPSPPYAPAIKVNPWQEKHLQDLALGLWLDSFLTGWGLGHASC